MGQVVRTALLAALCAMAANCGGGGSTSPPPPPPPPPPPNAAPAFTSASAVTVRENVLGVFLRAVATDPEGATISYTLGGTDAARFTFNTVTHEIRFAAQPDFEAPTDSNADNVYSVFFTASDGVNTTRQDVTISIANVAPGFSVRRIASGLNAPIFVAGLPDGSGRIVVVQRAGLIRVMDPSTGVFETANFLDISSQINTTGEKGLLSIAFSPNFVADRTFYLHMNPLSANVSEIRRYTTQANNLAVADATTGDVILQVAQPASTNHKGGTVMFDTAGRLLISLGDGGATPEAAQDTNSLRGKLLRIDPSADGFPADPLRDYQIPAANPLAAGAANREIYAMGLRNPFRFSVDPLNGDIFIGDVGQGTLEEVDRILGSNTALVNFGWANREGSLPFGGGADSPSFTLPVTEYPRTVGTTVTGGVVYRGPIEDLQGQYLFGDFNSANMWSVPVSSLNIGTVLPSASYTLRNTAFAPDVGALAFVANFGTDIAGNVYFPNLVSGELFRLEPPT